MLINKREIGLGISHNAIAIGTEVQGSIIASEGIRIDGKVTGDIVCANGRVIIGPRAEVVGDIKCVDIEIFGLVKGNISATESISLKSSSFMEGNMQLKSLQIDFGAKFKGQSTFID